MQKTKRFSIMSVLTAIFAAFFIMTIGGGTTTVYAMSDVSGHWAYANINEWVSKGYINGYEDGTFRPDNSISRAEFTTLATKAFNITNQANIAFSDVSRGDWYYDAVAKGVGAGYLTGYPDNTFQPMKEITREEAAVILCNILGQGQSPESANSFADSGSLSWSKGYVGTCVRLGVLRGDTGGTFRPGDKMTRAEAVTCLNAALKPSSVTPSVTPPIAVTPAPTPNINDNQTIATGEKLHNVTISGSSYGPSKGTSTLTGKTTVKGSHSNVKLQNLVIDELEIVQGASTLELDNVKVKKLTNKSAKNINMTSTEIEDLVINNTNAATTVDNVSKSIVKESTLRTSATLKDSYKSTSYGFSNVNIPDADVKKTSSFTLRGDFDTVNVDAENITTYLREGTISRLNLASSAKSATVNVASGATVDRAIIDARNSAITGSGTVKSASVNASGVTLAKRPNSLSGSYNPSYGSGGSGSGNNNNNNNNYYGRYTYTVQVRNSVGAPVNGATVRIDGVSRTTNYNGQADFHLDSGSYNYSIYKSGFTDRTGTLSVRNSTTQSFTLSNRNTHNITFNVVDNNNVGIDGASISLSPGYTARTTGANGALTMSVVPGYYKVTISKTGYTAKTVDLDITGNRSYTETLQPTGPVTTDVTFLVTDTGNVAIPTAKVKFNNVEKQVNANGKVTFNNVPVGNNQSVLAKAATYADLPTTINVTKGMAEVQLKMSLAPVQPTTGSIKFTAQNGYNDPITDFTVALFSEDTLTQVKAPTAAVNGVVTFDGLAPAKYTYELTVTGADGANYAVTAKDPAEFITVNASNTPVAKLVTVKPAAGTGIVKFKVASTGTPLNGATVELYDTTTPTPNPLGIVGTTNANGEVTLFAPAGTYTYEAKYGAYPTIAPDLAKTVVITDGAATMPVEDINMPSSAPPAPVPPVPAPAAPVAAPVIEAPEVIAPPAETTGPVPVSTPVPEPTAEPVAPVAETPAPVAPALTPAPAVTVPPPVPTVPAPEAITPAPVPTPVPAPVPTATTGTAAFNITAPEKTIVTLNIGGKNVQASPGLGATLEFAPGLYRYSATAPGCKTVYGMFQITAGNATSVSIVMSPVNQAPENTTDAPEETQPAPAISNEPMAAD